MKKILCNYFHKEKYEKALQEKYEELIKYYSLDKPNVEIDTHHFTSNVIHPDDPFFNGCLLTSQEMIKKQLEKEVPRENYTEEKEYLLIDTALENGKVMLIVCDFNGENIKAISAEGCKIIEGE